MNGLRDIRLSIDTREEEKETQQNVFEIFVVVVNKTSKNWIITRKIETNQNEMKIIRNEKVISVKFMRPNSSIHIEIWIVVCLSFAFCSFITLYLCISICEIEEKEYHSRRTLRD